MFIDIVTIGDAVVDSYVKIDAATLQCDIKKEHCKICFDYAEKIPIKGVYQSVGGNAANVAVGCRYVGFNSALLSEVGNDLNGHTIISELKKTGINTQFIKIKKQTTRYSIILNYKGERTILSHHAKRKYSKLKIPAARWIYYTSLSESFETIQKELEKYLKANKNVKLAVNPGSYQLKKGTKTIKKILPLAEVLILNKQEAQIFTGPNGNEVFILKELLKLGPKIVVITDSKNGSYATDGENFFYMPIYPLKAISKTGAGDAFTSGFLSALMEERVIEEALKWGTANSAGVIQKFGAQEGLLKKREIIKMAKHYSKVKPILIA